MEGCGEKRKKKIRSVKRNFLHLPPNPSPHTTNTSTLTHPLPLGVCVRVCACLCVSGVSEKKSESLFVVNFLHPFMMELLYDCMWGGRGGLCHAAVFGFGGKHITKNSKFSFSLPFFFLHLLRTHRLKTFQPVYGACRKKKRKEEI